MKKSFLLIITVCWGFSSFAQNVETKEAQNIAMKFIAAQQSNTHKSIIVTDETQAMYNEWGEVLYHVFNFEGGGFVIVSGDKRTEPVLAYSTTNSFKFEELNPAVSFWMNTCYAESISNLKRSQIEAKPEILQKWNDIATGRQHKTYASEVKPLLTSKWNQDKYYNALCPEDAATQSGYDNHVPNGCVALAMAQIMYYHRYPRQGQGSNSYGSNYGYLEADFANTIYNYEAMNDSAAGYSDALARLIYHAGIAVNMGYAASASGAFSEDVSAALRNKFKYKSTNMFKREDFSDAKWIDTLKYNLNLGLPVYYAAVDTLSTGRDAGHAFVCDGYDQNDMFHINWGWGGSANNYYTLQLTGAGGYNFTAHHRIIINIEPTGDTLNFFTGQQKLTATFGSFNDGSGHLQYRNNTDCSWLISPQDGRNITNITLKVSSFSLADGDTVRIYEGNSTGGTLIAALGGDVSQNTTYNVNTSEALVTFTSNGTDVGAGFTFTYSSTKTSANYCPTTMSPVRMTNATDSLDSGSGNENYEDANVCYWAISPAGMGNTVEIAFSKFDLNKGDMVEILQYPSSPIQSSSWNYLARGVERFTQENPPVLHRIYTIPNVTALVRFFTDNNLNGSGFRIYWKEKSNISENQAGIANLSVYPNPANDFVNVNLTTNEEENMQIAVYDMIGKVLYSSSVHTSGAYTEKIPTDNLAKGVYLLRITTHKGMVTKKLTIQ